MLYPLSYEGGARLDPRRNRTRLPILAGGWLVSLAGLLLRVDVVVCTLTLSGEVAGAGKERRFLASATIEQASAGTENTPMLIAPKMTPTASTTVQTMVR